MSFANLQEEVAFAARHEWFKPSIPVDEFEALVKNQRRKIDQASEKVYALHNAMRNAQKMADFDTPGIKALIDFCPRRTRIEIFALAMVGGEIVGVSDGEVSTQIDPSDDGWPIPSIAPSFYSKWNCRYVDPLFYHSDALHLWGNKYIPDTPLEAEFWDWVHHGSLIEVFYGAKHFYSKDVGKFEKLFAACHVDWISNAKDKKINRTAQEVCADWLFRKKVEERAEIAAAKMSAERQHRNQVKLRRIRKKPLVIKPENILAAASKLTTYATNQQ